jgi:hypothetical protein
MAISEFPNARGYRLGPTENTFDGVDEAAAIAARDAYFSSNPSKLAVYDGNSFYLIRLTYTDIDVATTVAQGRLGGAWFDYTPFLMGLPGEVASLVGVPVGEIPYKLANGTFGGSNMRVLEDGSILAPPGFGVESGSIAFGDALTVSEVAGFLGITNNLNGRQYTVIDFWTPRDAASAEPSLAHLIEAEFEFPAQAVDTTNIPDNPLDFNYTVVNNARTNALKFRTYAAMPNVRIKVSQISNGVTLKYVPNKTAWEEETGGIDWVLGDNTFDFTDSPVILNSGTQLKFEIHADSVALKGNALGVPYFTAFLQRFEFDDVITSRVYDAEDVRDKLASLSGVDRLSGTSLKENVTSVNTATGDVVITKATVGLANVDNTSDVNKPVSTAQATAIALSMSNHNAAVDPHPQYTTTAEAIAAAPVQSVQTLTGAISLTTANIPESGNLYYDDTRVQNYLTASGYNVKSVLGGGAGASVYNSNTSGAVQLRNINASGLITVTQNANDITISAPTVLGGTYTPSLTNVTNVTSSTAFQCQYMRIDGTVSVSGKVTIDPSSNGAATRLGISLPVASNIGAEEDVGGVGSCTDIQQSGGVMGDATNNRATLEFISTSSTTRDWYFNFSYQII